MEFRIFITKLYEIFTYFLANFANLYKIIINDNWVKLAIFITILIVLIQFFQDLQEFGLDVTWRRILKPRKKTADKGKDD